MASQATHAELSLDDIFGDCFFSPEGDTIVAGEAGGGGGGGVGDGGRNLLSPALVGSYEAVPSRTASRPSTGGGAGRASGAAPPGYSPVSYGGGIATTGLDRSDGTRSTVMGTSSGRGGVGGGVPLAAPNTFGHQPPPPPQQLPRMQFATPAMLGAPDSGTARPGGGALPGGGAARPRNAGRAGTGTGKKVERRERNREHAKRSRIRKKFLLESLQQSVTMLKEEN